MAIVLCICAILMAFSLAIFYTGSMLMANANARNTEEKCYQLARSFAHVLNAELVDENNRRDNTNSSALYQFANKFIENNAYASYDPDRPEHTTYYYKVENMPNAETYGEIQIALRKESNEKDNPETVGELKLEANKDYKNEVEEIQRKTFLMNILYMDVVSEYQSLTYHYEMSYYRQDTYKVEFRCNDRPVVWNEDDHVWHEGTLNGSPVVSEENSVIKYKYDTQNPVTSEYISVHKEGGISDVS